jgi:hypothetical protein
LFRLQHLFEFTRAQASAVVTRDSEKEFDKGYADAVRDLMFVAQKLGIDDFYAVQPDDGIDKARMMEIRSSQPRVFDDDAQE